MKRLLLIMLFLALGSFANGEVYKEYYPNGALFSETRVINGSMEGISRSYYPNGKIRNMKNKIEINGLIYCMGENEVFTGIFVEKLENIIEGHEIKETYDNGIIIKKEEYNRFKTRKNGYKMFLVKSMI